MLYQLSYELAKRCLPAATDRHYREFPPLTQQPRTLNSSNRGPDGKSSRPYNAIMAMVSDRCICLRKTEYSETSQIITLFSRQHGLLRVIAKGAHRKTKAGSSKFDGGVDLLDCGNAVFTHSLDKDLEILAEWHLTEGHLELHQTLRGIYLGQYSAELVSMLIEEHDPHPDLFDRLEQGLMEYATPRLEEAFLAFELDLLRQSGYLPELSACVQCGCAIGPRELSYFSPARGGIVCRNCEGTTPTAFPWTSGFCA